MTSVESDNRYRSLSASDLRQGVGQDVSDLQRHLRTKPGSFNSKISCRQRIEQFNCLILEQRSVSASSVTEYASTSDCQANAADDSSEDSQLTSSVPDAAAARQVIETSENVSTTGGVEVLLTDIEVAAEAAPVKPPRPKRASKHQSKLDACRSSSDTSLSSLAMPVVLRAHVCDDSAGIPPGRQRPIPKPKPRQSLIHAVMDKDQNWTGEMSNKMTRTASYERALEEDSGSECGTAESTESLSEAADANAAEISVGCPRPVAAARSISRSADDVCLNVTSFTLPSSSASSVDIVVSAVSGENKIKPCRPAPPPPRPKPSQSKIREAMESDDMASVPVQNSVSVETPAYGNTVPTSPHVVAERKGSINCGTSGLRHRQSNSRSSNGFRLFPIQSFHSKHESVAKPRSSSVFYSVTQPEDGAVGSPVPLATSQSLPLSIEKVARRQPKPQEPGDEVFEVGNDGSAVSGGNRDSSASSATPIVRISSLSTSSSSASDLSCSGNRVSGRSDDITWRSDTGYDGLSLLSSNLRSSDILSPASATEFSFEDVDEETKAVLQC